MKGFDFKVNINDYGSPVKKEELERVLKPFFQLVEVKDDKDA